MKELMRLDKYLADMGVGTRSEVKVFIKKRRVQVGNEVVNDPNRKVTVGVDSVRVDGREVSYVHYEYYMLNKPAGVLSATEDKHAKTVIDLIETSKRKDLFPVGRLDKDTVGLLLLTNDGELNHRLISPKWHVDKVYYAKIDKAVDEKDVEAFKNGITLDDGYKCKEGKLEIISSSDEGSEVMVTIQEGKYHQVKRMFEALGKTVVYLKRTEFGGLPLDQDLEEGEYRELTEDELALLKSY